jgi:hypothetical protein
MFHLFKYLNIIFKFKKKPLTNRGEFQIYILKTNWWKEKYEVPIVLGSPKWGPLFGVLDLETSS